MQWRLFADYKRFMEQVMYISFIFIRSSLVFYRLLLFCDFFNLTDNLQITHGLLTD